MPKDFRQKNCPDFGWSNVKEPSTPRKSIYYAHGPFNSFARGFHTIDGQAGPTLCAKKYERGSPFQRAAYKQALDGDIKERSQKFIDAFQKRYDRATKIRLSKPHAWEALKNSSLSNKILPPDMMACSSDHSNFARRFRVLFEDEIEHFKVFVSNSGWTLPRKTGVVQSAMMLALSHFSYHYTGGKEMLVNLQGGYEDGVL